MIERGINIHVDNSILILFREENKLSGGAAYEKHN